jgi:hypothetical protein
MSRRSVRVSSVQELREQSAVQLLSLDPLRLHLRIQRALKKVDGMWGRHWGGKNGKYAQRKAWAVSVANAIVLGVPLDTAGLLLGEDSGVPRAAAVCTRRRRVTVQRLVPKRSNFLKDEDNLVFAEKPLYDALKGLALIKDDSLAWVERVRLPQAVAEDGTFWTHVTVEDVDG